MKKVSRIFAGLAAIALFTACSSEEPVDGGNQPGGTNPVGDTAYMKISIGDVNDSNPSGAPKSRTDYDDGVASEHNVKNAQFFFFDANGVFVLKGQMIDPAFTEDNPADENIEYMSSDNILVLEGLTEKGWPEYMLTVLNAPDFEPASTIEETSKKLDDYKQSISGTNYMVMSTSSYFSTTGKGDKNHDNKYPYATHLESTDFYTTPAAATSSANAVKIYVERLAAKIKLSVNEEINGKTTYTDDAGKQHTIYKLTQTVAGDPNDQENTANKATTELYVEVLGWNLSGTANQAYISKQLTSTWSATAPYTGWDKPEYFRSFWAESAVYGQNPVANATGKAVTPENLGLVYTTFGTNSKAAGESDYCNENTNNAASLFAQNNNGDQSVITSQTTHVVLKTRVCDKDGKAIDMVSYHGVLYLKSHYIQYVLDKIEKGDKKNLNFYTKVSDSEYKQVTPAFFKLEADGSGKTGQVKVVVADETQTLYSQEDDGSMSNGTTSATLMASLKQKLADNQPAATDQYCATAYTDGSSVYYIPVEHNTAAGAGKEGYYGVVRNHWYQLNITSFSKVGFGVFSPDEVLIPEGPQDPLYYLGVNINVLSWKIVSQNVPL